MNLEAFVLGTGGSVPLPNRNLTSVLLRREGEEFLFDCGEGTQIAIRSLNLRWKKISAIFITHTHADHVTGIPGILMLSAQVNRTEPLYIIGPPRIKEYIQTSRKVLEMYINYEIIVKELPLNNLSQLVWKGDGFHIRSFPLLHSRPCVGYTLEESARPGIFYPEKARNLRVPQGVLWSSLQRGESVTLEKGEVIHPDQVMGKPRPGRKFSFVTDSLMIDRISKEVKNSDLLICEGMFSEEFRDTAHEKKHMTVKEAALIAQRAGGVRKLGLIHFSPRYANGQLKQLAKEAQSVFPAAVCLKDKTHMPISYKDQ